MNSYFSIMFSFSSFFFLFLFVHLSLVVGRENSSLEPLGRDEMVQLAGYGVEKLSSVLVSGNIVCRACLKEENDHQNRTWPVADTSVTITCKTGGKGGKYYLTKTEGITDEYGDFIIDLPSHLHANPNLDKICTVKVTRFSKNLPCRLTSLSRKPEGIRLSSVENGIRMYEAGPITFKQPSKLWRVCLNKRGDATEKASI